MSDCERRTRAVLRRLRCHQKIAAPNITTKPITVPMMIAVTEFGDDSMSEAALAEESLEADSTDGACSTTFTGSDTLVMGSTPNLTSCLLIESTDNERFCVMILAVSSLSSRRLTTTMMPAPLREPLYAEIDVKFTSSFPTAHKHPSALAAAIAVLNLSCSVIVKFSTRYLRISSNTKK